ncbi:YjdF family protein [Ellagibacter isourolithinifaciens]|uniref:YjdF family protein n=1 Tax=Ellagibacter isourolithinifaciens TaxID=2137581 RepID=UPI003A956143
MQTSVSSTLTVYHDGQFWVGLAEHVEDGKYGVARIVFGAEPSDGEILQFVVGKWEKLSFFGGKPTEASKPARNPKRRAREAAKALKQPAMSTKAQQALANQREAMKRESAHAKSRRHAEEAEARFEQRKLKRKQKHRGH